VAPVPTAAVQAQPGRSLGLRSGRIRPKHGGWGVGLAGPHILPSDRFPALTFDKIGVRLSANAQRSLAIELLVVGRAKHFSARSVHEMKLATCRHLPWRGSDRVRALRSRNKMDDLVASGKTICRNGYRPKVDAASRIGLMIPATPFLETYELRCSRSDFCHPILRTLSIRLEPHHRF
jgi:hypothetical protein